MTLDETLASLFGRDFTVDERPDGILLGEGRLSAARTVALLGIVNGMPLGVEGCAAARATGADPGARSRAAPDPAADRLRQSAHESA